MSYFRSAIEYDQNGQKKAYNFAREKHNYITNRVVDIFEK